MARFDQAVLRVLFVGLGGIGQRHLRNLRLLCGERLEVSAYRTRGEQLVLDDTLGVVAGESLDQKYGMQVYTDLERALATHPEIVFVTNPTSLHLPVALAAAEAGAHLFIEKPLAHTLEGVVELERILRQKGKFGFVAYQWRFHLAFQTLERLMAERVIGEVVSAQVEVGEYLPAFHPYEDYRRMYASRADLGGGVTLSQIHEIDTLTALFGTPERLVSMGGHLSNLEIDVDDVSDTLLEYRRGDGGRLIVNLHQDFLQRPKSRGMKLVGQRGSLHWSLSEGILCHKDAKGTAVRSWDFTGVPRNQPYLAELEYFLDAVGRGEAPVPDVQDGALSLSVALSILESHRSGMPVTSPAQRVHR